MPIDKPVHDNTSMYVSFNANGKFLEARDARGKKYTEDTSGDEIETIAECKIVRKTGDPPICFWWLGRLY